MTIWSHSRLIFSSQPCWLLSPKDWLVANGSMRMSQRCKIVGLFICTDTYWSGWFGDYYGQFINNSVDKKIEEVTHWHSMTFQPAQRNLVSSCLIPISSIVSTSSAVSAASSGASSVNVAGLGGGSRQKTGLPPGSSPKWWCSNTGDLFPTDPKCIQLPCEISMLLFFWDKNMNLWRLFLEGKFLNTKKAWLGLILRFHVHFAGCWKNISHLGNLKFP